MWYIHKIGILCLIKYLNLKRHSIELRKKLVKCYMWSIALYDAETWMLREVDQDTWKVLKCVGGEEFRRSFGPIT
jgi:hypothetical protein